MCDNQPNASQHIADMLEGLNGDNPCMPPTTLYGEGWMLRLVLQAAGDGYLNDHILPLEGDQRWFSEAKLYTPFGKARGKAYEGFTSVDGIVGDFQWNSGTQTGVELSDNPKRFEVFEAKMFSGLSKGVKAASWYDQAVRTVACMAETLSRKGIEPKEISVISFRVTVPETQISKIQFSENLSLDSMRSKIKSRIEQFSGRGREELDDWHQKYFKPLLEAIQIQCESWESLIGVINNNNRKTAIEKFYEQCLEYGGQQRAVNDASRPSRGHVYRVQGVDDSRKVVVCYASKFKSRVFTDNCVGESFPIENSRLVPVEGADIMEIPVPQVGEEKIWNDKRVKITSTGPCRSRVEFLNDSGTTYLVDNHLLKEASASDEVT